jgi:hypothetical protein
MMSPDDIEDVLDRLEGANISVAESDAQLLEQAATWRSTTTKRN